MGYWICHDWNGVFCGQLSGRRCGFDKRYGHYGYSICNSNNSKANLFSIFDNSIFDETEQN